MDGGKIEIQNPPAQLKIVVFLFGKIAFGEDTTCHLFADVFKKRWNEPKQLGKIGARKTLQAGDFLRPNQLRTRRVAEDFEIANEVTPPEKNALALAARPASGRKHFQHAAIDDLKGIARFARGIEHIALVKVSDPR